MPRKNRVPIGTVRPVVTVGGLRLPGGRRSGPTRVVTPPGPDRVWIGSDDPVIDVVGRLTGNPDTTPPQPRYQTDERHGRTSRLRYAGQDLIVQTIPIKFDGHASGTSVEGKIRDLERLAEPTDSGEPPLVRALGPGVRHQGLRWRVTRIEEDQDRASYADSGQQIRYAATVTLTQHAKDEVLALTGDNSRGIRNRTERVRDGEDNLHEFAKRVYGDRSKAKDIARANPGVRLGQRLKTGTQLRIP